MADLMGQGMAERGFVFVSLKLVHLVLSSQVCSMIISVHEQREMPRVPVCHHAAAGAPS